VASNSERLAGLVHANVVKGARKSNRSIPDLGLKKGPFYVLFMSSMSSVLVETGFLTNKNDAKLLRSAKYQADLAEEIAEGVHQYRQQIELNLASSARLPHEER
jgi:N-acetylmuramoyl-L-alanine amidase